MSIKRIRGATIVGNLVYTSGMGHREGDVEAQIRGTLKKIWGETFGDHRPSRTCVEVGLGSIAVEIELVAALPE